jgi:hypothetical protein
LKRNKIALNIKRRNVSKEVVKGKKQVIIIIITIIMVILISQLLYSYVIPRVTLDLKTVYHEATGGGGTGGLVNVNSKIINSGTVEAKDLKIFIQVLDFNEEILINETFTEDTFSPGQAHEVKLVTNGNCYTDFFIILEVQFYTSGNEYYEKFRYKTHEDAMNIGFEDSIFSWNG